MELKYKGGLGIYLARIRNKYKIINNKYEFKIN